MSRFLKQAARKPHVGKAAIRFKVDLEFHKIDGLGGVNNQEVPHTPLRPVHPMPKPLHLQVRLQCSRGPKVQFSSARPVKDETVGPASVIRSLVHSPLRMRLRITRQVDFSGETLQVVSTMYRDSKGSYGQKEYKLSIRRYVS